MPGLLRLFVRYRRKNGKNTPKTRLLNWFLKLLKEFRFYILAHCKAVRGHYKELLSKSVRKDFKCPCWWRNSWNCLWNEGGSLQNTPYWNGVDNLQWMTISSNVSKESVHIAMQHGKGIILILIKIPTTLAIIPGNWCVPRQEYHTMNLLRIRFLQFSARGALNAAFGRNCRNCCW